MTLSRRKPSFWPIITGAGSDLGPTTRWDGFPSSPGSHPVCPGWSMRHRRIVDWQRPAGVPVVGFGPSCTVVVRSDLTGLFPNDEGAKRLAAQVLTLAEVLTQSAPGWLPTCVGRPPSTRVTATRRRYWAPTRTPSFSRDPGARPRCLTQGVVALRKLRFRARPLPGLMACAEKAPLPAVRTASAATPVMADGFSCRTQLEQATGRRALHLAE